jgi:predicted  nucleic acid-binding Zn ribbon protein
MNDPNSSLSKIGRELCKAFEKAIGKPFYYFLFYYMNSRKKNTSCPICGKPWQEVKDDTCVSKRCEDCRLIA